MYSVKAGGWMYGKLVSLHSSHSILYLPGNQEVSCFGSDDHSDTGDNWAVECASSNSEQWQRDDNVRLRHVDTNT